MPQKYTAQYIDQLYKARDYHSLVELYSNLSGWERVNYESVDYGFPTPIFVFFELMIFWASVRSGVWTYFESTSAVRQKDLIIAMRHFVPDELIEKYGEAAAAYCQNQSDVILGGIDKLVEQQESKLNQWLWNLLDQNRQIVDGLL